MAIASTDRGKQGEIWQNALIFTEAVGVKYGVCTQGKGNTYMKTRRRSSKKTNIHTERVFTFGLLKRTQNMEENGCYGEKNETYRKPFCVHSVWARNTLVRTGRVEDPKQQREKAKGHRQHAPFRCGVWLSGTLLKEGLKSRWNRRLWSRLCKWYERK